MLTHAIQIPTVSEENISRADSPVARRNAGDSGRSHMELSDSELVHLYMMKFGALPLTRSDLMSMLTLPRD